MLPLHDDHSSAVSGYVTSLPALTADLGVTSVCLHLLAVPRTLLAFLPFPLPLRVVVPVSAFSLAFPFVSIALAPALNGVYHHIDVRP